MGRLFPPGARALWIATVAGNIGTRMQNVGAAWLMTSISPSPLIVSLVQTATSLPIFMLAIPAGALADVIDRRRLMIVTQVWMTGTSPSVMSSSSPSKHGSSTCASTSV